MFMHKGELHGNVGEAWNSKILINSKHRKNYLFGMNDVLCQLPVKAFRFQLRKEGRKGGRKHLSGAFSNTFLPPTSMASFFFRTVFIFVLLIASFSILQLTVGQ